MPRVWERFPRARLRVVAGPDPDRYWRRPQRLDPRIALHAFVEDVRPLYAAAWLVVVPLLVSAGTNIKVMEAMSCARALVTTRVGCAGLGLVDGADTLVRDHPDDFADAICALLADTELRARMAARARRTAEERFGWPAIAAQAHAAYAKLIGVPAR
jgi:glycosyltransferase involved in cell wall biosynthesis